MQAKDFTRRKDIILTASYTLGLMILTGIVSGTFYPAREGGGIAFNEVLANLGGATPETAALTISVGFVLTVGSALAAFVSNKILEGGLDLRSMETLAGSVAIGAPLLHETVQPVGELTNSDPLVQTLFLLAGVMSYVYIAEMP